MKKSDHSLVLVAQALGLGIAAALQGPALAAEGEQTLAPISVREAKTTAEKFLAPTTSEGATRQQIADTVNAMNTEDAFKYLPNILVRKRFTGDTDAPITSRTTGVNAGARSLIYADGVLLSTLINNNNGNGSPRWFMVSPEEIERIDVLYGPFSAAFPGNSYGVVAEITTRMPAKAEATAKATQSWQDFKQYGTQDSYRSEQLAATLGNRLGDFSFWLSLNHLDSHSQPVTYGTLTQSATAPGPVPVVNGAFADRNRTGGAIQVIGAGNLTHTLQDNAKIKLAYDFSPQLQGAYTFGIWQNQADLRAQTYLTDAAGNPYYGAAAGNVNIGGFRYAASAIAGQFAAGKRDMEHHMHSLTLKTKGNSAFDWDVALSRYDYTRHQERSSTGVPYSAALNGGAGRILDMEGTGWTTVDIKGTWRPDGPPGAHTLSGGAHYDLYKLTSPTYNTADWIAGGNGSLFTDARGKTATQALWLQDVWRFAPRFKATLGARYEHWRAFDGFNFTSATAIVQPGRDKTALSPKASLSWEATTDSQVTVSLGRAVRFPTVGELYQTIQVGATFQSANPNLKPEDVVSAELSFEKALDQGKLRISLFAEQVKDALIAQTANFPGIATPTSFMQNVDKTRQRGIELVYQAQDVLIRGLELSGSLTYVDARILRNDGYVPAASTPGATSVGKHTPNVPDWRATLLASYRPDDRWTYTLAGRYSGRFFATVDNTDINGHTYQGFERFFVADARVRYQVAKQWSAALGVDNLNNRKYFLFHPFPQRTVFAELKFDY